MKLTRTIKTTAALMLFAPGLALATTGYFGHGYGIKAKGMGGVGIALPQDAIAAATNPAGMVFVGNRVDVGIDWFRPTREAEVTGSPIPGFDGTYDGNETHNFFVPEFGYNRMVNPGMSIGVSVFANGGLNSHYDSNPFASLGGSGEAVVDLSQLFVSPTLAMMLTPTTRWAYRSSGVPEIPGQRTAAVCRFLASPNEVTNTGYDNSFGWGVRVGWTGNITPASRWARRTRPRRA